MSECGLHYSDSGKASITDTFESDKERVCPIMWRKFLEPLTDYLFLKNVADPCNGLLSNSVH